MNKNILIMAKLPPPITGATKMTKVIVESSQINGKYNLIVLPIMFPKNSKDYGKIRLNKVIKVFKYAFKLISILAFKKIDLIYFTLTPKRFPFF